MDATQEAFARAFARWSRLRDKPWVVGWVMTTALNVCRRSTRKGRPGAAPHVTHHQSAEVQVTERLAIDQALQGLPARQRQAVILHYLEDLPVTAVAALMGLSEGGVKANLFKARATLRNIHDEEMPAVGEI